jgi:asparagine synthase (glutamine-hydrolysing)
MHPDAINALGNKLGAPEAYLLQLMQQGRDGVDALTRADFHAILPDDFLVKVDRASMANSLEVRTPFLDYRLVEHAFGTIPPNWKVSLTERRRVQNLMARRYLPKDYQLGRKQGFSIPMDEWLRHSDFDARLECLPESVLDRDETASLVRGLKKGRANGARLFALMMLTISQDNLDNL